jgi:hypothetical protein
MDGMDKNGYFNESRNLAIADVRWKGRTPAIAISMAVLLGDRMNPNIPLGTAHLIHVSVGIK